MGDQFHVCLGCFWGYYIRTIEPNRLEFLNLEYDGLVISSPFLGVEAEFLESAPQICTKFIKSPRLTAELDRE